MGKNKISTQPYKGTKDYYPEDMYKREYLFNIWRETAYEFGYEEYDTPLLENADIYRAKSGEELANTQLYNFTDKGGREIAIRPEMTPSLARIVAAKIQQLPKPIRWFNISKYYRYEKPQRGRTREFFQLNIDIMGIDNITAEIEIFQYIDTVMRKLNAPTDSWKVYVNNRYLMDYFFDKVLSLNNDFVPHDASVLNIYTKISPDEYPSYLKEVGLDNLQIGKLIDFLKQDITYLEKLEGSKGAKELLALFKLCKDLGLKNFEFKPYIMRGITYYTGVVIEMFDVGGDKNPRALFGGGRYDDLLEIFGKEKIPAFGIGWGNITMEDYLETYNLIPPYSQNIDILVALTSNSDRLEAFKISKLAREKGYKVETQLKSEDIKKQLRYANKKGINKVIFKLTNEWCVKDMKTGQQKVFDTSKALSEESEV